MTGANETLVAAAAVLQSLARDEPTRGSVSPAFNFEFPTTNDAKSSKLPGGTQPSKGRLRSRVGGLDEPRAPPGNSRLSVITNSPTTPS